jgi:hypothetical protein
MVEIYHFLFQVMFRSENFMSDTVTQETLDIFARRVLARAELLQVQEVFRKITPPLRLLRDLWARKPL